jgi:hypothetical protein
VTTPLRSGHKKQAGRPKKTVSVKDIGAELALSEYLERLDLPEQTSIDNNDGWMS